MELGVVGSMCADIYRYIYIYIILTEFEEDVGILLESLLKVILGDDEDLILSLDLGEGSPNEACQEGEQ